MRGDLQQAAAAIRERGAAAALTGAGVSVESGIPDFRSAGGIWTRYDPVEYASIDAFLADPPKVWRFLLELASLLEGAKPNAAHRALADLERAGVLRGIATQNVDGLHQAAGSQRVLELHGGGRRLRCVECGALEEIPSASHGGGAPLPVAQQRGPRPATALRAEQVRTPLRELTLAEVRALVARGGAPTCMACGGWLKPDVVLFGETLPEATFAEAEALVRAAPALLVIGTSATVWPAAGLPELARRHGALVVEINREATDLTGDVADVSLFGPAGEVVPALAKAIRGM